MLTTQQITQFRNLARQQGFTEVQISQEIARKNQELTRQNLAPKPIEQNFSSADSSVAPVSPSVQSVQPKTQSAGGNMLGGVANFLIPRTTQLIKTVSGALDLSKGTESYEKANMELQRQSTELIRRAQKETNPERKRQLLEQSRELSRTAALNTDNFVSKIDQYKQDTGITDKRLKDESSLGYAAREGVGIAGEAATWVLPVSKIVQGARIIQGTSVVKRILQSAVTGGLIGGVYGATSPDDETLGDRVKDTVLGAGVGAATGGVTGTAGQILRAPAKAVSDFVKGNKSRIDRIFRVNPIERIEFRKSTKGMDFAEELISRDAQEMAGKSYEELLELFTTKKDEAYQSVENLLKGRTETVSKAQIVNKIKSMMIALSPDKGNVNQESAITALNKVMEDLNANPGKLTLQMANRIKRQLQDAGDSAFAPNRNPTPSSQALAKLSTFVKDVIEKVVPEVEDANKSVQLYQLAKRSIERTEAREANKISSDGVQKFLHSIPAAIGGAGGFFAGGPVGGGAGGILGLVLGSLVSGTVGNARLKYLTPEVQTKLIAQMEQVAKQRKVKNPSKFATSVVDQITNLLDKSNPASRFASSMAVDGRSPFASEAEAAIDDEGLLSEVMRDSGMNTKSGIEKDVTKMGQEAMVEDPNEMVQIRNTETGEVKQVTKAELGQYGLGDSTQEQGMGGSAIPSKKDILTAMIIDVQTTGGKNLSKLNTLLDAYKAVFPDEEGESKLELTDTAVKNVTDMKGALSDIRSLYGQISKSDKIGPVKGFSAKNPYDTKATTLQSEIDRVRQVVGKALEGGVLRKEDEDKYKKILPTMNDTKETALEKLNQLYEKISEDLDSYVELQRDYGKGRGQENILKTQELPLQ